MKEIRKKLFSMQDKKYKQIYNKLCPNVNNIIGVRIPKLRIIANNIAKKNFKKILDIKDIKEIKYYEEIMIYGMVIGYANISIDERIKYLDKFVSMIDNWSICDSCCATFKFTIDNKEKMWNYFKKYDTSNKEFELRFLIVMLMTYFVDDVYIDKVLEKYNKLQLEGYYSKMAMAWAISVIYIKYSNKILKLLKNNKLDDFTFNKTIQKLIESNRINKLEKEELIKLKRK